MAGYQVPEGVIKAYLEGRLEPEEEQNLASEISSGNAILPSYIMEELKRREMVQAQAVEFPGAAAQLRPAEAERAKQAQASEPSFWEQLKEGFTGERRMTPEVQALPSYTEMPEAEEGSTEAALGVMLSGDQEEIAGAIQQAFPGVTMRQDEKGNPILKSKIDGKEYAIRPGFEASDLSRAIGQIGIASLARFLPGGRGRKTTTATGQAARLAPSVAGTALSEGLMQLGIESAQAALGGRFDPQNVALASAAGAGLSAAGKVGGRVVESLRNLGVKSPGELQQLGPTLQQITEKSVDVEPRLANLTRETLDSLSDVGIKRDADKVAQRLGYDSISVLPAEVGAGIVRQVKELRQQRLDKLARGVRRNVKDFARAASPDLETIETAERLGFLDYLQPQHISTNSAFNQIINLTRSQSGSLTAQAEDKAMRELGQRAVDMIESFGGTKDLGGLSNNIRSSMKETVDGMKSQTDDLYKKIDELIGPKTNVKPQRTIDYLVDKAEEMGGVNNLSQIEKRVLKSFTDKPDQVTYALFDELRKDVGELSKPSIFADPQRRKAKTLYGIMSKEHEEIAENLGGESAKSLLEVAKPMVQIRKSLEDDMQALFGKKLEDSLVSKMLTSINSLNKTESQKLINLVNSIPEEYRKDFMASGILNAFGKKTAQGELNFNTFANFWESLNKSDVAKNAVMSNLPDGLRPIVRDLGNLSVAIRNAGKRSYTGASLQTGAKDLRQYLGAADGLFSKITRTLPALGKSIPKATVYELGAQSVGLPGAGVVGTMTAAYKDAQSDVMQSFMDMLGSSEFKQAMIDLARSGGQNMDQVADKIVKMKSFRQYAKKVDDIPSDPGALKRWLVSGMRQGIISTEEIEFEPVKPEGSQEDLMKIMETMKTKQTQGVDPSGFLTR